MAAAGCNMVFGPVGSVSIVDTGIALEATQHFLGWGCSSGFVVGNLLGYRFTCSVWVSRDPFLFDTDLSGSIEEQAAFIYGPAFAL